MKRIFRFLASAAVIIASLSGVFLLAGWIYYHATSLERTTFLGRETVSFTAVPGLLAGPDDTPAQIPPAYDGLREWIGELQRHAGGAFDRLMPFLDMPALFSLDGNDEALLVIDTGYRSLLASGSFFAIRGVTHRGRELHFAMQEQSSDGFDWNLYHIALLSANSHLYLAFIRNILLIAESPRRVTDAILAHRRHDHLADDRLLGELLDWAGNTPTTIIPATALADRLTGSPRRTLSRALAGLPAACAWQTHKTAGGSRLHGRLLFAENGLPDHPALARLAAANRYRSIRPSATPGISLLFDDAREFLGLIDTLFTEKRGTFPALPLLDWIGNEMAVLENGTTSPVLLISILDRDRARENIGPPESGMASAFPALQAPPDWLLRLYALLGGPARKLHALFREEGLFLAADAPALAALVERPATAGSPERSNLRIVALTARRAQSRLAGHFLELLSLLPPHKRVSGSVSAIGTGFEAVFDLE